MNEKRIRLLVLSCLVAVAALSLAAPQTGVKALEQDELNSLVAGRCRDSCEDWYTWYDSTKENYWEYELTVVPHQTDFQQPDKNSKILADCGTYRTSWSEGTDECSGSSVRWHYAHVGGDPGSPTYVNAWYCVEP